MKDPRFLELYGMVRKHVEKMDAHAKELAIIDFAKGQDWFNSPPLSFERELKGKIVVLDFWTYCCINCIHILPDLTYLEEKYAGYPVAFVGVHSAKFDNEKVSENIEQAVLRYEIKHPVVNDDQMRLWRAIGVRSWPSLAIVGPKGNLLLMVAGEGQRDVLDAGIAAALDFYPENSFRHDPIPMTPLAESTRSTSPLSFPGKLAIDDKRGQLFISDSNNNRVVVTDLEGKCVEAIGSGRIGLEDGSYDSAQFNRLQGLAVDGDILWVADAENHALRKIDLVKKTVTTVAGDGTQGRDYSGGKRGREQLISTPWDVIVDPDGKSVYIAMAGTHQIWRHDKTTGVTENYSGSGREQNYNHENRLAAAWSQPSGLTIGDGKLFIADCESSSIRSIDLESGATATIVGGEDDEPRNLFAFGDVDGIGNSARLQHALGVWWHEPAKVVYVADTYNHRLKVMKPAEKSVAKWVGSGKAGFKDGKGLEAQFAEPSGFAMTADGKKLFVADTNNHAIRIVAMDSLEVTTLKLEGIPKPASAIVPRSIRLADLPGTPTIKTAPLKLEPGKAGELKLKLTLPAGHKYQNDSPSAFQLLAEAGSSLAPVDEKTAAGRLTEAGEVTIPVRIQANAKVKGIARVEALAYFCADDGVCRVGGVVFEIPVERVEPGAEGAGVAPVLAHAFTVDPLPFAGLYATEPETKGDDPEKKKDESEPKSP